MVGGTARRRILISAFSCLPGRGSEPGLGWACANEMARHHDVWVMTRARHREPIEAALARDPVPGLNVVYIDLPDWILRNTKAGNHFQAFYYLWQVAAYVVARRLCREMAFDLVHHVTFAKFWAPAFVALLPVPFVWGPVGGGEKMPPGFAGRYTLKGRLYERIRDAARWVGECDPFVRMTARRSQLALATTNESAKRMRVIGAREPIVYPAIGITRDDLDLFDAIPQRSAVEAVRFISVGRLIHWKGFDLGLAAFARTMPLSAEYWIVGDGPERHRLERQAEQLGIGDRVQFLGEKKRDETLKILGSSDVLVHPSLHDSGGLVCLEALAARRPVICLDWAGPPVQVAEGTGFCVPVRSEDQVIDGLARAMRELAEDEELRQAMGKAGRDHVERNYFWPRKIEYYCRIYEEVLGQAKALGPPKRQPLQRNHPLGLPPLGGT